jgi:hypothetical protein
MSIDSISGSSSEFYGFFGVVSGHADIARRGLPRRRSTHGNHMDAAREEPLPTTVTGTVMRLGERHRVASYMRNGMCWIAEFRGERAELWDATTWMRQVPAALSSHGRRAAALATMTELTPDMQERIEALHRQADKASCATALAVVWIRSLLIEWLPPCSQAARQFVADARNSGTGPGCERADRKDHVSREGRGGRSSGKRL